MNTCVCLGCISCSVPIQHPKKLLQVLPHLADDPSWKVREVVATLLRRLLEKHFDIWFVVVELLAHSSVVNLQRTAIVGTMIKTVDEVKITKILNLYLPHLKSKDVYIKKNLGPFALPHFATRCPDLVFALMHTLAQDQDEMIRWNLLMAFSQRLGTMYSEKGQEFITLFKHDERVTVQRAVKSLQRTLNKNAV